MSFTRVWSDTLPTSITKALKQARVPLSAVSFEVHKIDNKTDNNAAPLLSYRANVPMNPASVMKLVTTFLLWPCWGQTLLGKLLFIPMANWATAYCKVI
ncbi:MAG: hypothetical protein IPF65_01305 [Polaromonas sp.]|nr:hypothetical protein [Polaromonas sp.]